MKMETSTIGPEGREYGAGDDKFCIASKGNEDDPFRRGIVEVSVEGEDEESCREFMEEIRRKLAEVEPIMDKEESENPHIGE